MLFGGFLGYLSFSESLARPSIITYEPRISNSFDDKNFQHKAFLNKGFSIYFLILLVLILV